MTNDKLPEVIGTTEAGQLLGGLSREAIRLMIEAGTINAYKLGREWAIYRSSVLEEMERRHEKHASTGNNR